MNPNTNNPNPSNDTHSNESNDSSVLRVSFILIITYLTIKLIILPVGQTAINIFPHLNQSNNNIKIDNIEPPELSFPDIVLLSLIFLFQPQTSKIFESFDLSSSGIKAKFRELKEEVNEAKEEMDRLQQKQLDKIEAIQQFMYQLMLTETEIEKLEGLKKHTQQQTPFDFYVSQEASKELRRLRNSRLIKVKSPYHHISELEKASQYGDFKIDLTQYCELTSLGEKFLYQLTQISEPKELN